MRWEWEIPILPKWLRPFRITLWPAQMGIDTQKWREHDSWFVWWVTAFDWQVGLRWRAGRFPFPFFSVWMGGRDKRGGHFYFPFPARMIGYFGFPETRRHLTDGLRRSANVPPFRRLP